MLARRFVGELSERFGVGPFEAGSELLAHLESRAWPGNVRELRNALESLIALSPPDRLDLTLLEGSGTTSLPSATLDERLRAYERGLLISALRASEGNRTEAAKALGIGRTTLYEKIQRFGLADDDET